MQRAEQNEAEKQNAASAVNRMRRVLILAAACPAAAYGPCARQQPHGSFSNSLAFALAPQLHSSRSLAAHHSLIARRIAFTLARWRAQQSRRTPLRRSRCQQQLHPQRRIARSLGLSLPLRQPQSWKHPWQRQPSNSDAENSSLFRRRRCMDSVAVSGQMSTAHERE